MSKHWSTMGWFFESWFSLAYLKRNFVHCIMIYDLPLSETYFELERYINIFIFSTSQRIRPLSREHKKNTQGRRIRRPTTVWQGALCRRLWADRIMFQYPINICQLIQKHPNKNIIVNVATTRATNCTVISRW